MLKEGKEEIIGPATFHRAKQSMEDVVWVRHVVKDLMVVKFDHILVIIFSLVLVNIQLSVDQVMIETSHFLKKIMIQKCCDCQLLCLSNCLESSYTTKTGTYRNDSCQSTCCQLTPEMHSKLNIIHHLKQRVDEHDIGKL